MFDVSASGSKIVIKTNGISTTISEFYDEGTPFDTNEIEVTGNSMTLNGQLILWRKPTAYTVSVTVIPESQDDEKLCEMLQNAHIRHGISPVSVKDLDTALTIEVPSINGSGSSNGVTTFSYSNGRILGGPTGPSTDAEGKKAGRTYTFVFEQMVRRGKGVQISGQ